MQRGLSWQPNRPPRRVPASDKRNDVRFSNTLKQVSSNLFVWGLHKLLHNIKGRTSYIMWLFQIWDMLHSSFSWKKFYYWQNVFAGQIWPAGCSFKQGRNEVRWRPGQEASLAAPCSNLRLFGNKFTILKIVLVTLLGLFSVPRSHLVLSAVIRCPHSDSAPGELCPP